MKKIVLTYGIIAGLIVAAWMFATIQTMSEKMNSDIGMYLGFGGMIVAFAFIFVAVKSYRDKLNHGFISFGTGFQIGLYITLIASTFYVISWFINYYFFVPDFMEKYSAAVIDGLKESGASAATVQAKVDEMADFNEMYKNPFFNALFTYTEILPVGLLVSLITALILKKKPEPQVGM